MANKTTRPIQMNELKEVMECITKGFEYTENGKQKKFRPNKPLEIVILLQTNLGLRLSDIRRLSMKSFRNGKVEIVEKKTNKIQYRDINENLIELIEKYVIDKELKLNEPFIKVTDTAIQKQLRIICEYLQLENISTHSFRKFYATTIYNQTNDIEVVKELLNHSSIATTQRYIRVSQEKINEVSRNFFIDLYN